MPANVALIYRLSNALINLSTEFNRSLKSIQLISMVIGQTQSILIKSS